MRGSSMNDILKSIAEDATKLSKGTNSDVFSNRDKFEGFTQNVYLVLGSENQDWAIETILDVSPKLHEAGVAFLASSQAGIELYESISSFSKKCLLKMNLTLENIELYRRLLKFYYSDYTTKVMLPKEKGSFYKNEYLECLKEYNNMDQIVDSFEKLKIAFRMLEIAGKHEGAISEHIVRLKINEIQQDSKADKSIEGLLRKSASDLVFISYAREDYETENRLYKDLARFGVKPWLDQKDMLPGENWKVTISNEIKRASYFLALISSNSVNKRGYVQKELKIALDILDEYPEADIFIIPVVLNRCEINHQKLKDLNWVDLYTDYDEGIKQIVRVFGKG